VFSAQIFYKNTIHSDNFYIISLTETRVYSFSTDTMQITVKYQITYKMKLIRFYSSIKTTVKLSFLHQTIHKFR